MAQSGPQAEPPPPPNVLDFSGLDALLRDAPFPRWLGLTLVRLDEGGLEISMPWREEILGSSAGNAHGGVLASLVGHAADMAVAVKLGRVLPTVDLRVDYHRPALSGPLLARAELVRLGHTIATADVRIHEGSGALVTTGRGLFFTAPHEAPHRP